LMYSDLQIRGRF